MQQRPVYIDRYLPSIGSCVVPGAVRYSGYLYLFANIRVKLLLWAGMCFGVRFM